MAEDGWEERGHAEGGARNGESTHEMKGPGLRGPKGKACDVTASNPPPG